MQMSEHATWTGSPEGEETGVSEPISAAMMSESERLTLSSRLGLSHPQILNVLDATPISRLCNCFDIYRSYQQFFAGYYKNFAELCVEHHLLRLRNRLVFEAIGIVFFDVCFYRFCLGVVSETTHVPVHFVLRQDTQ